MKDRLLNVWNQVHTSFWFVPTVMAVAAALLSFLALDLDRLVGEKFAQSITVAGTVFSITIVALTLASSQFGPRLLRNFVRDTGNQITLGTFTATFLYCILILRTIRAQDEGAFVPYISVTIGVGLAVASLGVLIYFVHHVSITIQAENLIARVGRELRDSVDAHFPEIGQKEPDASIMQVEFQQSLDSMEVCHVTSQRSGYLGAIDRDTIVDQGREKDMRIVLRCSPGDFVLCGDTMCEIWHSSHRKVAKESIDDLRDVFSLNDQRTEEQDVRYGARQLAEIACRSLSPGINDPYTAMGCVDWISDALVLVLRRDTPREFVEDEDGVIRLREYPPGFASLCHATIEPVVAYGLDSPLVAQHLVMALGRVAENVKRGPEADVLHGFLRRVAVQAKVKLKDEGALAVLLASTDRLEKKLEGLLTEDEAARLSDRTLTEEPNPA
jgi:uncharacterized membrane protein